MALTGVLRPGFVQLRVLDMGEALKHYVDIVGLKEVSREGDRVFWHGSSASRMLRRVKTGIPVSLNVCFLDGLVLARSGFHHSVNYRSVTLFGQARALADPEEVLASLDHALKTFDAEMTPLARKTTETLEQIDSLVANVRTEFNVLSQAAQETMGEARNTFGDARAAVGDAGPPSDAGGVHRPALEPRRRAPGRHGHPAQPPARFSIHCERFAKPSSARRAP